MGWTLPPPDTNYREGQPHLPAEIRRAWISLAGRQLVEGGKLLLTVDTVPFTDDL